jgi:hypothetical protein
VGECLSERSVISIFVGGAWQNFLFLFLFLFIFFYFLLFLIFLDGWMVVRDLNLRGDAKNEIKTKKGRNEFLGYYFEFCWVGDEFTIENQKKLMHSRDSNLCSPKSCVWMKIVFLGYPK